MSNPIEDAVLPLKSEALVRAEKDAKEFISRIVKDMEAKGWDLEQVAPYPRNVHGIKYIVMRNIHNLYQSVMADNNPGGCRRPGSPDMKKRSLEKEAKFVKNAIETAGVQYDLFVAKLVRKIGEVKSAKIEGSHVWGFSILTVVKLDGTVERWKTQQIVNQSKLGLLFNQWPSRKMK